MKIIDKKAEKVLDFWFKNHTMNDWFRVNDAFDTLIKTKFYDLHLNAIMGELHTWRISPEGALAEIIILDQFSRNIYRHNMRSYLSDAAALVLAQSFISNSFDKELTKYEKLFAYLPFMHSESLVIQKEALALFTSLDDAYIYDYAKKHHDVIQKFGRFPHRNIILNRDSTPQEIAYLTEYPNGF